MQNSADGSAVPAQSLVGFDVPTAPRCPRRSDGSRGSGASSPIPPEAGRYNIPLSSPLESARLVYLVFEGDRVCTSSLQIPEAHVQSSPQNPTNEPFEAGPGWSHHHTRSRGDRCCRASDLRYNTRRCS